MSRSTRHLIEFITLAIISISIGIFFLGCTNTPRQSSAPVTAPVASEIDAITNNLSAIDDKIISIQLLRKK